MTRRRILFVCLGNICRSPLAEGIARTAARRRNIDLDIDSAGTSDTHRGEPPCGKVLDAARRHGLDLASIRSRPVVPADRERFTHIVALDESVRRTLERRGFAPVVKLGDFGYGGADVPDPYYDTDPRVFDALVAMIESCVTALFDTLYDE